MTIFLRTPRSAMLGIVACATVAGPSPLLADSKAVDRAPAVHAGAYLLQDEPTYCADLAQDFCARVPGLKQSQEREKDFAPILQAALKESSESEGHRNLFSYLKSSLLARGYPLKSTLKAVDLEKHLAPSEIYREQASELAKIFVFDATVCGDPQIGQKKSTHILLEELSKTSGIGLPADENLDILRAPLSSDTHAYRVLRDRIRSSESAKKLMVALGDYDSDSAADRTMFGQVYSSFLDTYSQEVSKVVNRSRQRILALKPQLKELSVLCHLSRSSSEVSQIEEDECDVSTHLDVHQVDGFEFATIKPDLDVERLLAEARRQTWTQYQRFLNGEKVTAPSATVDQFKAWKSKRITTEALFLKSILQQAESDQVASDIDKQIRPLVLDVSETKIRNEILCKRRLDLFEQGIHREYEYVQRMVRRSEGAVSVIQQKMFPKHEMDQARENFAKASSFVQAEFQRMAGVFTDPAMANKFAGALKNLSLYDPAQVKDVYRVDPYTQLRVLDYSSIPNSDHFFSLFLDGSADALLSMNDNNVFLVDGHLAQLSPHSGVFLTPVYRESYKNNPSSMLFSLSHEMAHSMDPSIFKTIGAKFPDAFEKVLHCLSQRQSLGAKPHQHSECFADWFATEVLASAIAEVKPENRFLFAQDAFVGLCEQSNEGAMPAATQGTDKLGGRFATDVHLSPRKRINGIIGAHPAVREALGCRLPSAQPYCGLTGDL